MLLLPIPCHAMLRLVSCIHHILGALLELNASSSVKEVYRNGLQGRRPFWDMVCIQKCVFTPFSELEQAASISHASTQSCKHIHASSHAAPLILYSQSHSHFHSAASMAIGTRIGLTAACGKSRRQRSYLHSGRNMQTRIYNRARRRLRTLRQTGQGITIMDLRLYTRANIYEHEWQHHDG